MINSIKYKLYTKIRMGWWGRSKFGYKYYRCKFHRKKWSLWRPYRYKNRHINYRITALSTYPKQLRWQYKNSLVAKQQLRYFYGNLRDYQVKNAYRLAYRTKNSEALLRFFQRMESRVDVLLFRLGFASSVHASRQLIEHKKVLYNGRLLTTGYASLKSGDILHFCPTVWGDIKTNLCEKIPRAYPRRLFRRYRFFQRRNRPEGLSYVPNWLEVDYTFLAIAAIRPLRIEEVSFPFRFAVNNVFRFYNY